MASHAPAHAASSARSLRMPRIESFISHQLWPARFLLLWPLYIVFWLLTLPVRLIWWALLGLFGAASARGKAGAHSLWGYMGKGPLHMRSFKWAAAVILLGWLIAQLEPNLGYQIGMLAVFPVFFGGIALMFSQVFSSSGSKKSSGGHHH